MNKNEEKFESITIKPIEVFLYVPPIVWKGDSVGHIGKNDVFFWVLEGECFLHIDSQSYIVRPGQLAYLPKGKRRAYTHASDRFSMYEMAFSSMAGDKDLMELLGLTEQNYVVDIPNIDDMSLLFENSYRKELFKDPFYDVAWCSNILNIIKIYAQERQKQTGNDSLLFRPVLDYMEINMGQNLHTEDLASIVYMQPTYFIKRFHKCFGLPPIAYLNRMRMYKAMGMLAGTNDPIEKIARDIGIFDTSYFSRIFKKHCNVTPTQYRSEFKR